MNPEQLQQSQSSQLEGLNIVPNLGGMMEQLESILLYGTLASVAILIPFLILYILSSRRKSKAYKAITEIQKTLHEMNERDKARDSHTLHAVQPLLPTQINRPIASSEPISATESEVATGAQFSDEQSRL